MGPRDNLFARQGAVRFIESHRVSFFAPEVLGFGDWVEGVPFFVYIFSRVAMRECVLAHMVVA